MIFTPEYFNAVAMGGFGCIVMVIGTFLVHFSRFFYLVLFGGIGWIAYTVMNFVNFSFSGTDISQLIWIMSYVAVGIMVVCFGVMGVTLAERSRSRIKGG